MRHSKAVLPIIVLAAVLQPSRAAAPHINPAKAPRLVLSVAGNDAAPIKASLTEGHAAERGRVAMCANLAAIRGVSARTSGADYATQNRVLELSFVLCMSGTQTRD